METQPALSPVQQAEKLIAEFGIEKASLFDHKPVLRVQVPDSEFARVLELRTAIVEKLKTIGFRFIALDLNHNKDV